MNYRFKMIRTETLIDWQGIIYKFHMGGKAYFN